MIAMVFFPELRGKTGREEGGDAFRYLVPLENSQDSDGWSDLDKLKTQSAGNHIPQIMCYCC